MLSCTHALNCTPVFSAARNNEDHLPTSDQQSTPHRWHEHFLPEQPGKWWVHTVTENNVVGWDIQGGGYRVTWMCVVAVVCFVGVCVCVGGGGTCIICFCLHICYVCVLVSVYRVCVCGEWCVCVCGMHLLYVHVCVCSMHLLYMCVCVCVCV